MEAQDSLQAGSAPEALWFMNLEITRIKNHTFRPVLPSKRSPSLPEGCSNSPLECLPLESLDISPRNMPM